ncbi:hypothetical protein MLOOGBEN_06700 [Bacillus sp. EB106-08-02-XG196]|uniref:hypothetical protein n=1 Tax=Bacillus sp. EB106-08-02-XG196 TaxID=2737049 RepID=UPI0015C4BD9D|nr:hypothetical protein [Bacillus sp. EB106-08-02-XG196]NWQ40387.1 hypothetical protein [Bacillus sp. EB106-08-02-XG196]
MNDVIHIDVAVMRDEKGNFGVGAEFLRINDPVKVASLFYDSSEFNSANRCLKAVLPELMREADAKTVRFRSKMEQFKRHEHFQRSLAILAQQDGLTVFVSHRRKGLSINTKVLAFDALSRKESIVADI